MKKKRLVRMFSMACVMMLMVVFMAVGDILAGLGDALGGAFENIGTDIVTSV